MAEFKIVGWTDFDSDYPTRAFEGEEINEAVDAIREEIANNGYIFSGDEHQLCATGVPVFSDGTCFRASMRCWGSIMASVYTGPDGEELSYMDFYMSMGSDSTLPEYKDIDVEPASVDNDSIGCAIQEDYQMVSESLALGMMFMTTDKVLKKMAERLKGE